MKISFANSISATWLTKAVGALRNRNKVHVTNSALSTHDVPQITSGWDYRPRKAIRRDGACDCGGVETAEVVTSRASTPKENDDVWFNFTNP
jgi:hypothetical protein